MELSKTIKTLSELEHKKILSGESFQADALVDAINRLKNTKEFIYTVGIDPFKKPIDMRYNGTSACQGTEPKTGMYAQVEQQPLDMELYKAYSIQEFYNVSDILSNLYRVRKYLATLLSKGALNDADLEISINTINEEIKKILML